ncbi:cache domain-containing sensor histidine kinase [Breznakiella homolactica]|uniref:histidine kinase n=1 Tax=Breznakiella homolactica TaxID=2798577 RepID=A0A7T7XMT6_9SPIR|nr:sensor histidine kinase [Breznakiella homolactica]QQO09173.1 sensor histidine kinase [Breznakiella homolactica]
MKRNSLVARWRRLTFSKQLILTFLGTSVIPLIILLAVQLGYTATILEEKIVRYARSNSLQASTSIQSALRRYEDASFQLMLNETFWQRIRDLRSDSLITEIMAHSDILREFQTMLSYHGAIQSIGLQVRDSGRQIWVDRLQDKLALEQRYGDYMAEMENIPVYRHDNKWALTSYFSVQDNRAYSLITYRQKIIDLVKNEFLAAYVMNLDGRVLAELCAEASIAENPRDNFLYITDSTGVVISHPDQTMLGRVIPAPDGIIHTIEIPNSGWLLHNVLDRSYAGREFSAVRASILAISAFLFLCTVTAVLLLSRSRARALRMIVSTMHRAELGDFGVTAPAGEENEVSRIAEQFNAMMKTILHQMELVREAARKEKEAEIRSLEAQINPHFLYNTLNSINWLAIENGQTEISSMLHRLASILRYRIADSNSLVTLSTELRYLEEYLRLQKYRFSDNFEYTITADPAVRDCLVHKLLFQPFIENSIEHGFEQMDSGGILAIAAEKDGDRLRFSVRDNGKGMDRDRIRKLFYDSLPDGENTSIGIPNVMGRLRMYYEDRYSVEVKSSPGMGTEITVCLPLDGHPGIRKKALVSGDNREKV